MLSIAANVSSSTLNTISYAATVRLCYLISEKTVFAGDVASMIDIEDCLRALKIEHKLRIINQVREESGDSNTHLIDIDEFLRIQKILRKIKHPPKEQIIIQKKMEAGLNLHFEEIIKARAKQVEASGLLALKPLLDMEEEIGFYYFTFEDSEKTEDKWFKASDIFRKILPSNDKNIPSLFALTPEIIDKAFIKDRHIYYGKQKKAKKNESAYFEECFTFPNILFPTITDLTVIKSQLSEWLLPAEKKLGEWITMIDSGIPADETLAFLRNEVKPLYETLQKEIENNTLLNDYKNVINYIEFDLKILIGEMPASIIWEYLKHFKVMNDETWEILSKEAEKYNRRWPVLMLFHDPGKPKKQKAVKEMPEVLPSKKYLDI